MAGGRLANRRQRGCRDHVESARGRSGNRGLYPYQREWPRRISHADEVEFTACSTTLAAGSRCGDAGAVIRSYASFSQAADENAVSRIYIGIHFRRAVEEGVRHGRKIGAFAVERFMKPSH